LRFAKINYPNKITDSYRILISNNLFAKYLNANNINIRKLMIDYLPIFLCING